MTSPLARRLEQEQCPLQVTFGKGRFSRRDSFTWEVFICRGMKGSHSSTGGQSSPRERAPSQKTGWLAPPNHRGRREVCLPLSRQVETSFLSRQEKEDYLRPDCLLYLFKRWKRAYAQEERVELPPTFKKRNLVRRPAFKTKR